MKQLFAPLTGAAFLAAFTFLTSTQAQDDPHRGRPEILVHMPNPYGGHPDVFSHSAGPGGGGNKPIRYHGGPVMLGGVNVYVIWYGNWAGNTATTIVSDFLNSVGGSPYYNINTTYYDASGSHIQNQVAYKMSFSDNYSRGSSLSDSDILTIVTSAITGG